MYFIVFLKKETKLKKDFSKIEHDCSRLSLILLTRFKVFE